MHYVGRGYHRTAQVAVSKLMHQGPWLQRPRTKRIP
jgi:hypothetical protein